VGEQFISNLEAEQGLLFRTPRGTAKLARWLFLLVGGLSQREKKTEGDEKEKSARGSKTRFLPPGSIFGWGRDVIPWGKTTAAIIGSELLI